MDKILKIIIIFELILLLIFLIGYFYYEDILRVDKKISCEIRGISINLSGLELRNINGEKTSLLSVRKEDLNS
jgi:hypothetical protein